jgi:trimeric autotransporter adhesin
LVSSIHFGLSGQGWLPVSRFSSQHYKFPVIKIKKLSVFLVYMVVRIIYLCLFVYSFHSANSQLRLVKDFAASIDSAYGSDPAFLTEFNNGVIFSARHNTSGVELWFSNGTKDGTLLISDINPRGNSYPSNPKYYTADSIPVQDGEPFVKFKGKIFFAANDGTHGFELWESDGTQAGTKLVKDIYPGNNSSSIKWMLVMGSALYFSANDGLAGQELWKSDGTLSGTVLFKDINVGPASGSPSGLTLLENKFVFTADNGTTGSEPWISDGSTASTFLLVDAFPGPIGVSFIDAFGKDSQFYIGQYPTLIRSNGTPEGTTVLPSNLEGALRAVYNNKAFYTKVNEMEKLYYTNGSVSGSYILYQPMEDIEYSRPYCEAIGDELFFGYGYSDFTMVTDESPFYSEGIQILKYDPENDSFAQFARYSNNYISVDQFDEECFVDDLISRDGKFYVKFYGAYGSLLAMKEPDPSTSLDPVASSLSVHFVAFMNDKVFSSARLMNTEYKEDWELFMNNINGQVKLTNNYGTASSLFFNYTSFNDNLLFQVHTPDNPFTAYRSDGYTATGVDLPAWNEGVEVNGSLYFNLTETTDGLWKSDGTTATTLVAKDVFHLMALDQELFFLVNDIETGVQLWKTNGSTDGEVMVKELNQPYVYSGPTKHITFKEQLLFTVANDDGTYALFRSDGSSDGTILIQNFGEVYDGFNFVVFNDYVYFNAMLSGSRYDLWRTDGTPTGTEMVAENDSETGPLYPLAANDSYLFYFMAGPALGTLYTFNGITFQAVTEGDIYGGVYDLKFLSPSKAIFSKGLEIWVTEGTPETTKKIYEFNNALNPGNPSIMKVINGKALLKGVDVKHGREIWVSDGTTEGTKFLLDVNAGDDSSYPQNLTQVGNQLFIEASTYELGSELWAINISPSIHVGQNEEEIENNSVLEFSEMHMELAIKNTGLFDLALLEFVIDGVNKELFQIAPPETTILPYDSLILLNVTFTPEEAGQNNATLTIKSNDAITPDFILNLKATVEVVGTEEGIADVNLYPNPSNGIINIRSKLPLQKVRCYDLTGREVTYDTIQSDGYESTLVIHGKGLMLLKIQSGEKTIAKKVIVK